MTYQYRQGEPSYLSRFERGERIVIRDEGFYYRTRECEMIGPFESRSEAALDLNTFIQVTEIQKEIHTMIC